MSKQTRPYINREISWLSFNERVLQEADDPSVPLITRIKFLGIFSSNLNEFFRVRVATVNRMINASKQSAGILKENPKKILSEIEKIVIAQGKKFEEIYINIVKELEKKNIFILTEKDLDEEQGRFVREYFHSKVRSTLVPIMLNSIKVFPYLKDQTVYLAIELYNNKNPDKIRYSLIELPTDMLPRFLVLPRKNNIQYLMFLDDIIRYCLDDIFSIFNVNRFNAYSFKITRDAELEIDDDITQSFYEKISKSVKNRKKGPPVRFVYDQSIPPDLLSFLKARLEIDQTDTILPGKEYHNLPGGRYHNTKDFMSFPKLIISSEHEEEYEPIPHKDIIHNRSIFDAIKKKDILLHYPYHSFYYIIDLFREAAIDPKVRSIKMTLYRVAKYSNVIKALINAVKNGKSVTIIMEFQARFDEEANLYWANKLKDEGAKVIHGIPSLKVHSKLLLITRKERGNKAYYAYIGTGNFNEDTTKIYSDHCLLTCNRKITGEVVKFFNFFKNNYKSQYYKTLIVSPFTVRTRLESLINNEIKNARAGKEARIILKLNNLVDRKMIDKLYHASMEGVTIDLVVRGICSLVPGIKGISENITAFSIVDKYLEHSRIFVFHNNGDKRYYLSSADLMERNLDRRFEVITPVFDSDIQQEIDAFLDIQLADNTKSRIIDENQNNSFKKRRPFSKSVRAQIEIYNFLKDFHTKPPENENKIINNEEIS